MDDKDLELADRSPPATPSTFLTTKYRIGFALVLIVGALVYFGYTAFKNGYRNVHVRRRGRDLGPNA